MFYVESGIRGVPQQLSVGGIKKGQQKTRLLKQLRHPRDLPGRSLEDWRSPQEFYDAVIEVVRADPPAPVPQHEETDPGR